MCSAGHCDGISSSGRVPCPAGPQRGGSLGRNPEKPIVAWSGAVRCIPANTPGAGQRLCFLTHRVASLTPGGLELLFPASGWGLGTREVTPKGYQ